MTDEIRVVCECGRQKWTKDDLQRWRQRDTPEPEWARAICWTAGAVCQMQPIGLPDLRERMLAFASELESSGIDGHGTLAVELRRRIAGKETP